jgi:hypothetical protein
MGSHAPPAPAFIEPCGEAKREPVAQLPTRVKIKAPLHLPTHRDERRHSNRIPA